MQQRVLEGQIELLEKMKNFSLTTIEQMEALMKAQQSFIRSLDEEGMDVNFLKRFEEYVEEDKAQIKSLMDNIENEEIPYIEGVIRYLEDTPY